MVAENEVEVEAAPEVTAPVMAAPIVIEEPIELPDPQIDEHGRSYATGKR
ncbi:MAG: 30S ribosomal protein S9, partial [Rhodospirillaceae bacterium]|nr:30S ribosomal protein S9 [Rhodospirillaceae bacterium]